MKMPQASCERCTLQPGAIALPQGLLFLEASRALIAADVHLGYEDVIGGALPLWSTVESLAVLSIAIQRVGARELILLGDIIHGSRMSEGAERTVTEALATLRAQCELTLIAGNHEGRSRGSAILGSTSEYALRDGWILVHGDKNDLPDVAPRASSRAIIGHLHPSISLGGDRSAPAFLASESLIVVPALTPYSRGLSVFSSDCARAMRTFDPSGDDVCVVAVGEDCVYPFGSLATLKDALRGTRPAPSRFRKKVLHAD